MRDEPAWHTEGMSGLAVVRSATPHYGVTCEVCSFTLNGYAENQPYRLSPTYLARNHHEQTGHSVAVRMTTVRIYEKG